MRRIGGSRAAACSAGGRRAAPRLRRRRLRRLLRQRAARHEFRPDPAPGAAATAPELEAPAGRLSRARGTVRVSGTPVRRPQGQRLRRGRRHADGGAEPAAGLRSGGRLRRRRRVRARKARGCWGFRGEHVFGVVPGQRLVGTRHPGLGVPAARAAARQVLPDVGVAVGGAAGRARSRARHPSAARPSRRRRTWTTPITRGRWTSSSACA